LIGHEQKCAVNGVHDIVQDSGVGPTFYILMKSDLSMLFPINIISKYADDILT